MVQGLVINEAKIVLEEDQITVRVAYQGQKLFDFLKSKLQDDETTFVTIDMTTNQMVVSRVDRLDNEGQLGEVVKKLTDHFCSK